MGNWHISVPFSFCLCCIIESASRHTQVSQKKDDQAQKNKTTKSITLHLLFITMNKNSTFIYLVRGFTHLTCHKLYSCVFSITFTCWRYGAVLKWLRGRSAKPLSRVRISPVPPIRNKHQKEIDPCHWVYSLFSPVDGCIL